MGSDRVTCHSTQVNVPHLNPRQTGQRSVCPLWLDGRLSWSCCWIHIDVLPICFPDSRLPKKWSLDCNPPGSLTVDRHFTIMPWLTKPCICVIVLQGWVSWYKPGRSKSCRGVWCFVESVSWLSGRLPSLPLWPGTMLLCLPACHWQHNGEEYLRPTDK